MKIGKAKSTKNVVESKLIWNKAGNKVGARTAEGENLLFTEYPDWLNKSVKNINYRLSYNEGKLLFLSPVVGIFPVKFVEFAKDENGKLEPVARNGSGDFGPWTKYQFRATLRMTDPAFNGMPLTLFLTYGTDKRDFVGENGGMAELVPSNAKVQSKDFITLTEFLDATGISEQDYKFRENLLPTWEKVAQKKNRTFSVVYQDGYIQKIVPSDEEFDESEDDEMEEVIEEDDEDEMSAFDSEDDDPPF